jgi:hypothetical protein
LAPALLSINIFKRRASFNLHTVQTRHTSSLFRGPPLHQIKLQAFVQITNMDNGAGKGLAGAPRMALKRALKK